MAGNEQNEGLYYSTSSDSTDYDISNSSCEITECCSRNCGKINVTVLSDDITNQTVDAIVNTAPPNLDLCHGGVASKSLVNKGGHTIQQELNNYGRGISEGVVAVTSAGSLPCQHVFHITLKTRRHGRSMAIFRTVTNCLAEADKAGHSSIAFPALGTGQLGYPKRLVAHAMLDAVEKYQEKHQNCNLTTVLFVVYFTDTVTFDAFISVCNRQPVDIQHRSVRSKTVGSVKLELVVGTIADQNTDVIMISSTRNLDLSEGRLSKSVSDAVGPSLQNECTVNYPQGIQHGEVAKLGPGNLPCKYVYCGSIPHYHRHVEGDYNPQEVLQSLVTDCLRQADNDNMTTISFPTLGTGFLKYPPHLAAHYMVKAMEEYISDNPRTNLTTVVIVIQGLSSPIKKNLKAFENEFKGTRQSISVEDAREPEKVPDRMTPEFCLHMYQQPITPPFYWSKFTPDKSVKDWKVEMTGETTHTLIDVDNDTFQLVERIFQNTWDSTSVGHGRDAGGLGNLKYSKVKVTKVQRIENLTLYSQYGNKRQELFHNAYEDSLFPQLANLKGITMGASKVEKQLDDAWKARLYPEVNEEYFLHGTKPDAVSAVYKQGLDPRLAKKAVLGPAVYMAESSTKSDQYTDPASGRIKTGLQMFLVRACLGRIHLMKKATLMKRPPCLVAKCLSDVCDHEKRYHSIISEGQFIFREFVVYDSSQVYPEYLITYDRL